MMNFPVLLFLPSVFVLWFSAQFGTFLRRRRPLKDSTRTCPARACTSPCRHKSRTLVACWHSSSIRKVHT